MNLGPKFKKKLLSASIASVSVLMSVPTFSQNNSIEEEVIVKGVRAAQASAINVKRDAASVVDGISSEDIGKLPDVTISDSLQRITGVQVERTAGESGAVQIRGFGMVGTSLNGETFLSATSIDTPTADFGDLPSQLIKGANVYKSAIATNTTKGITGVVDLQTRRPFDMESGFTSAASIEADRGSITEETDPTLTGLISWNNDKVGALLTFATTEKNLATNYNGYSDTSENGGIGAANNSHTWGANADVAEHHIVPQGFAAWNKVEERERDGISFSAQADLSEGFQLTADYFYSKQKRWNRRMGFVLDNRWQTFGDFAYVSTTGDRDGDGNNDWPGRDGRTGDSFTDADGNTWVGVNAYDVNVYRFKSFTQTNVNEEISRNFNMQLDYDNGGALTGQVRVTMASAEATMRHGYSEGDVLSIDEGARVLGPGGFVANEHCNRGEAIVGSAEDDGTIDADGGCYAQYSPFGIEDGDFTLGYDASGDHPVFSGFYEQSVEGPLGATATPADYLANIDSYHVGAFSSEGNTDDRGELDTFSTKWNYAFEDSSYIKSIDVGTRLSQRSVDHDQFSYFSEFGESQCGAQWKAVDQFTGSDQVCQDGEYVENTDTGEWEFVGYTMLPPTRIDEHNNVLFIDDFGPVQGVPGVWVADPRDYDDPYAFHLRTFGNVQRVEDPGQTYEVDLDEHSTFVQANFEVGPVTGNLGVRVIDTKLTIKKNVVGDGIEHSGANYDIGDEVIVREYTDTLPSLNLAYTATEDLVMRFSAGKNMMPLQLDQWGGGTVPGRVFNDDCSCMRLTDGGTLNGNPELDPWRSTNYDLTAEWYFGDASLINAGYFKVDIESFVTSGSVYLDLPDADGIRRGPWRFSTNLQGEGGEVDGFEIGSKIALSDFTDTPLLSNFGFDINATFSDSESNEIDIFGKNKPFVDHSETTYNIVAWFENNFLSTRIAYNYRSERLDTWGNAGTGGQDLYQDPYGQLDLNVTWHATDNISVYLNGSNITEEFQQAYVQFEKQKAFQNLYEARWALGVRATF